MPPHVSLRSLRPALVAPLLLLASLSAHGGAYRGPGSVVPPNAPSGGSGGGSASGGTAAGPAGAGPSTGSTGGAGPSSAGPVITGPAPRGSGAGRAAASGPLDDDLGRWEFWWEFGKDPYLRLREAIYRNTPRAPADDELLRAGLPRRGPAVVPPTADDVLVMVEALAAALQQAQDRDTRSGALVALAKIGRNPQNTSLYDLFVPLLASGEQELRETAALAFGIAGQADDRTIGLLGDLVADREPARRLAGNAAIGERTRAFAAFALGLLLRQPPAPALSKQIVDQLVAVLHKHSQHSRDLKVAAIEALRLLPSGSQPAQRLLRQVASDALLAYYEADVGPGEQLLQAHVPTTLARLVGRDDARAARLCEGFVASLQRDLGQRTGAGGKHKANIHVSQSLTIALGELAPTWQAADDAGATVGELLLRVYRDHRDEQTRSFALLALAHQGGAQAQQALLRELSSANKAIEQPWCAMALGVLHARSFGQQAHEREPNAELASALLRAFQAARNPNAQGALAVALGLVGDHADVGDTLQKALLANEHREDAAGYLALALGMLRHDRARPLLRELLLRTVQRPFLRMQVVRALGLLGDGRIVEDLHAELTAPDVSIRRLAAAATALGQIGDRRSVQPLVQTLANRNLPPLSRAFAAVALGSIGDRGLLPWNSSYATQINYRAATETLTDGQSGLLDIL